jgi:poly(A) polymerase
MLTGPKPSEAIKSLSELRLLKHVLPEVEAMKGVSQAPTYIKGASRVSQKKSALENDILFTTLRTLKILSHRSPSRSVALGWAALLYEVGKPHAIEQNEGRNFNGHEVAGAEIVREMCERLRMKKIDIDRIADMTQELLKFRDAFKMREATLERFVRTPYFDELLELHRAQALSSDGNLAFYEYCAHRRREVLGSEGQELPKLIDGKDLIQLGFKPGPEFSAILRTVEDLALERRLISKEQALEYVVSRFVK